MIKKLLLVAAVVATALAGGVAGSALATDRSAPPDIPSAKDVYRQGMTLHQIATAASGQPGDVAPPCPSEAVITKLKAADIQFGPCDPYPEAGEPFIVPAPETAPAEDPSEVVCPASTLGKETDARVFVPCAVGAELVSVAPTYERGAVCAQVGYRPDETSEITQALICQGAPNADGVTIADEIPPSMTTETSEGSAR